MRTHNDISENINLVREYITEIQNKIILENRCPTDKEPALFTGIDYKWKDPRYLAINYDKIFPLKKISFEGIEFFSPNDSDYILENYYGKNYMFFPPCLNLNDDHVKDYINSLTNRV